MFRRMGESAPGQAEVRSEPLFNDFRAIPEFRVEADVDASSDRPLIRFYGQDMSVVYFEDEFIAALNVPGAVFPNGGDSKLMIKNELTGNRDTVLLTTSQTEMARQCMYARVAEDAVNEALNPPEKSRLSRLPLIGRLFRGETQ